MAPMVDKAETLHVILQVEDDGAPSLVAYRRAIITIQSRWMDDSELPSR